MSTIILCNDSISETFDCKALCAVSTVVSDLVESAPSQEEHSITLQGCTSNAMRWIKDHVNGNSTESHWPAEDVSEDFVSFVNACDYLNIATLRPGLLSHIRKLLLRRSPDELRTAMAIEADDSFTQEECQDLREQNTWIASVSKNEGAKHTPSDASASAAAAAAGN